MSDMSPLLQKQRQLQEQTYKTQEAQSTQQSTTQQTQQTQTQTQQEMEDVLAVQQTVQANAYLQNERDDADPAEPDPAREELLIRQMTVGHGKRTGMDAAHNNAQ